MNKVYQVGIIGLGVVGERVLKQFIDHPRFKVTDYCEPNEQRLDHIQKKYGEVQTHASHSDLLNQDHVDLVYLAVPPKFHHEIALNIISHNKHILCEKPLANSTDEAREMYEAAENKGVINAMNFPLPYHHEFLKMKEVIAQGQLGEIKRVEFHMYFPEWPRAWQQNNWIATREQGGFIREIGPHYLHLTTRLIGIPSCRQSFVDFPADPKKSEVGFMARLNIENIPVLFNGVSEVGQKEYLSYKIYGEQAVLELRNWRELYIRTKEKGKEKINVNINQHVSLMDELANALDGKEAQLVTFEEGYQVQKVLEDILKMS